MSPSTNLRTETNRRAVQHFLIQQDLAYSSEGVYPANLAADPETLLSDYLAQMEQGLRQPGSSSLKMLPAYVSPDKSFRRDQAVPVLDAGGTNLRRALISLPEGRAPQLDCFAKRELPALRQTLSSAEFLAEIADFAGPVLQAHRRAYGKGPDCLGFCFSYPTQILLRENGDLGGKLLEWSKEVKVPELVGQEVGKALLEVLRRNFGPDEAPRHITIVNDTVATLLAGRSAADDAVYSDFIGYILGTGINSCHAESSAGIAQLDHRYESPRTVVNLESGNYALFPQSPIDREYDSLTQNPGTYLQEKACSGRYWGELACMVMRAAAREGLLPECLTELPLQSSAAVNALLQYPSQIPNAGQASGPLAAWLEEQQLDADARERIYLLVEALLERSALFTAVNMAACILRCGRGQSPLHPICLTVDGSTFYAMHRFSLRVCFWLDYLLSEAKGRKRYYRIKQVKNAPLLGAAIAALGS